MRRWSGVGTDRKNICEPAVPRGWAAIEQRKAQRMGAQAAFRAALADRAKKNLGSGCAGRAETANARPPQMWVFPAR